LQEVLDSILPNMLPLALTLLCWKFIQKGSSLVKILFFIILFGIVGVFLNIL
jgi:mannose/fructose/N-acetylgalactosamine-specific phosphotransferase system component IID